MIKTIYSKERHELSEKLIRAREEAGLTQKQVYKILGISQSDLSKLENGQRRLDFLILLHLAELYKKPIEFFVPNAYKNKVTNGKD